MLLLLFIVLSVLNAQAARILGVFPAPGFSQFILAQNLMTEVARRGHEVTVISSHIPQDAPPNYRTIKLDGSRSLDGFNLFALNSESLFENIKESYLFGNIVTELTLENEDVKALLRSDEHFDLVIVEQFFSDALKAFAPHFNAPLVLFTSMGAVEWNKYCMGVPMLPTINAVSYTQFRNRMTFFQRVTNVIGTIYDYLYRNFVVNPIQKKFLKDYFPQPMDFDTVVNNASLMLLNSHATTTENVLLPSNVIEIGGFHIKQNPLSPDIQKLLDGAKNGAILFSMGSNLLSSDLSNDTLSGILRALGRLDQLVLWKFETDLPDKPSNVHISKWLKQRDILAHPNIRLFITHGGLLSTTEAIHSGIPMVGIPVFADQKMNMARASSNGVATIVKLCELSEKTLFEAVNATLTDLRFRNNAKKMSALLRDRPVKPLDLALYWIEHTIRFKGWRFETAVPHLYWFQMYMIDILVFVLFNFLVFHLLAKVLISFVGRKVFGNDKTKVKPD